MTNTEAHALLTARWTRADAIAVGETTADRGTLLAPPRWLGDGLAEFDFVLGTVVLSLDCDFPVIAF